LSRDKNERKYFTTKAPSHEEEEMVTRQAKTVIGFRVQDFMAMHVKYRKEALVPVLV
jgi:hypothetical protein